MRHFGSGLVISALSALVLLTGAPVRAQERASIIGTVSDSSGAVLPGVTVEAASPVLIERSRSAITDGSGRYAIIDLRPGTYTVTFELQGFNKVVREGIILEGAFAAQVNAALSVGTVEETVTVTGASPVVDVQSTQNQAVLNRDLLNALPAARTMQGGAGLVPGVSFYSQGFVSSMSVHGSATADQHIFFDGMNIGQNLTGTGSQANGVSVNELAQTELVYDAGSQSAENALGGVRMDSIPKEGGNNFSGVWRTFGSKGAWQGNNITDELRPFISTGSTLDYSYETNAVLGGPIMKDRLWFLVAQRVSQSNTKIPLLTAYFPQGGTSDSGGQVAPHSTVRLTYQVSQRNKFVFAFYKSQGGTKRFDVGCSATSGNSVSCISPEASYWLPTPLQYAAQAKYTSPLTSRFLLEIGQSLAVPTYKFKYQPEDGPFDVGHLNRTTSVRTVASSTAPQDYFNEIWNTVGNVSYVTGSHNLKAGVNQQWGWSTVKVEPHGDLNVLTYTNVNGVPTPLSATLRNTPYISKNILKANLGLFAQDKWTIDRLTLTYGARYDYFNGYAPAEDAPAGRFVPARHSDEVDCIPCWNDWSIRVGGSYDLFGTGKTALKTSVGKFLAQQALGLTGNLNPMAGQTDTRAWTDRDGNGSVLDAAGNVQFNELGASTNLNLAIPGGSQKIADGLPRATNWEESVSVQHELFPRVSVTGGYYRRQFYDIGYTQNLALDPNTSFTPFTITVPANANLPNGGGQKITLYNQNQVVVNNNISTWSTNNTRVYNGFEISVNARIPRGFIFGGITTERTATDNCTDLQGSNPNLQTTEKNLAFCRQVPPFRTLYKGSAAYTLPYEIQFSATLQWRPGISIGSDYTYTCSAAQAAATGCTALTANITSLTTTVVDPTTQFYPYVKTNDIRVSRTFRHNRLRLQPFMEVFNVMNLSTVLTVNETVGPNYFQPNAIVQARRFQFGGQVEW
jgi:Carboxypeptidase regulatory-like domain